MTESRNPIIERHTLRRPRNGGALLDLLPSRRSSEQLGGVPLYLPLTGAVVVPYQRLAGVWVCVVMKDPWCPTAVGASVRVTDREAVTALCVDWTVPVPDLVGDTLVTAWLARVEMGAGHRPAVARAVAAELRETGTDAFTLDRDTSTRLQARARVLAAVLHRHLDGLVTARLLRRDPADAAAPPTYRLRLPEHGDRGLAAHSPHDNRQ